MPLPQHTLPIVGIHFPNKRGPSRRFELELCVEGEELELRPEPENRADPEAVAVYSARGVQIGYVPAERCARLTALIRQGRDILAVFQGFDEFKAYARIAYDGDVPVLPKQRNAAAQIQPDSESGFWPDPTYDD